MMVSLQQRVELWIRDQRARIPNLIWPQMWPPSVVVTWPWSNGRQQRKLIQQEYEKRKKQIHDICIAVKAESVSDLQDVLCAMVLSECVYKRPAAELVRAVNKFKADFDGQVVSLERVQPSSDHVPHRYLLAETGDTLFASFIGTKQYKDVMVDANILQGAIFHEDPIEDPIEMTEHAQVEIQMKNVDDLPKNNGSKPKQVKSVPKPAAHRGFMARAKGIPALELYRLAQKKKRKLVLCGHSLGGAVAVLATLAILRVVAASTSSKEHVKVQVKCITFSQPPVGNAALRDYVNRKGWQKYFKTYCIPEDLVPRILSPAYFHHYNSQSLPVESDFSPSILSPSKQKPEKQKESDEDQLVLGLGPVQNSFWRLSRLVPLEAVRRQIDRFKGVKADHLKESSNESAESTVQSSIEDVVSDAPQSLEIQEGSDGISLKPFSDKLTSSEKRNGILFGHDNNKSTENNISWRRVPSLPSYVPFGQLYILGNSSVESLSSAEYSKLTSVRSVIAELRERLQSHSMKSYRSRFQRIYDGCMKDINSAFLGIEQIQQFPHLQEWLGISVGDSIELGHIVESPVIRTATSLVPLGWNTGKNAEPFKVDVTGIGLHLCTRFQARVNGNWCATTVESFPSAPEFSSNQGLNPQIQTIRVLVGAPLKRPPKNLFVSDSFIPEFSSIDLSNQQNPCPFNLGKFIKPEGLNDFVMFCTTDFSTISKEVHVRTRRVRFVGLEGSGKTCLLKAVLNQGKVTTSDDTENFTVDNDVLEGIAGGVCYSDSAGVNLQDLSKEASKFREELWTGIRDISKKTDLVLLVHNLSHKLPRHTYSNDAQQQPALTLLLDEAKAVGIPYILAITNKFAISANMQRTTIDAVLHAYRVSLNTSGVIINSCPYVMPSPDDEANSSSKEIQNLIFSPLNLVKRPFRKKPVVLPVEGVTALCQLVHRNLKTQEEVALQELARDRLMLETAREHAIAANAIRDAANAKSNSLTAAAVGASIGAGLGIVMALVMGAASALRKP